MTGWVRKMLGLGQKTDDVAAVRRDAERRLNETRNRWPEVDRAGSILASLVEQQLRQKGT